MSKGSSKAAPTGLTERDRYWLRHIGACARSGKQAKVYAEQHGLSLGALYEAKCRLVRRGAVPRRARAERVSFARVEVTTQPRSVDAGAFRLQLSSGTLLEWAAAPGIEVLGALIERLEARG